MENICRSKQAPFQDTLAVINGKWKLKLLYELTCEGTMRYGQLKRSLPDITHKMLSAQLKELEKDAMIIRKEYQQVPPKVEYSLAPRGQTFVPVLDMLCDWGMKQLH